MSDVMEKCYENIMDETKKYNVITSLSNLKTDEKILNISEIENKHDNLDKLMMKLSKYKITDENDDFEKMNIHILIETLNDGAGDYSWIKTFLDLLNTYKVKNKNIKIWLQNEIMDVKRIKNTENEIIDCKNMFDNFRDKNFIIKIISNAVIIIIGILNGCEPNITSLSYHNIVITYIKYCLEFIFMILVILKISREELLSSEIFLNEYKSTYDLEKENMSKTLLFDNMLQFNNNVDKFKNSLKLFAELPYVNKLIDSEYLSFQYNIEKNDKVSLRDDIKRTIETFIKTYINYMMLESQIKEKIKNLPNDLGFSDCVKKCLTNISEKDGKSANNVQSQNDVSKQKFSVIELDNLENIKNKNYGDFIGIFENIKSLKYSNGKSFIDNIKNDNVNELNKCINLLYFYFKIISIKNEFEKLFNGINDLYNFLVFCNKNSSKGYVNITEYINKFNPENLLLICDYKIDIKNACEYKKGKTFNITNDLFSFINNTYIPSFSHLKNISFKSDIECYAFSYRYTFDIQEFIDSSELAGKKITTNKTNKNIFQGPKINDDNGKCYIFDDKNNVINNKDDIFITFGTDIGGIFDNLYKKCKKIIKINEGNVYIPPYEKNKYIMSNYEQYDAIDDNNKSLFIMPVTFTLCSGLGPKTLGIATTVLNNIRNYITDENVKNFINKNILKLTDNNYIYHVCYLGSLKRIKLTNITVLRNYNIFLAMLIIKYMSIDFFNKNVYIFINTGIKNIHETQESKIFLENLVKNINSKYSRNVNIDEFIHNDKLYSVNISVDISGDSHNKRFNIFVRTFSSMKNNITYDSPDISFLEFVKFSEKIIMTTGDLSFQDAIALGKIVYHDYIPHKRKMADAYMYCFYQYLSLIHKNNYNILIDKKINSYSIDYLYKQILHFYDFISSEFGDGLITNALLKYSSSVSFTSVFADDKINEITNKCIEYIPFLLGFIYENSNYDIFYQGIIMRYFNFNNNFKNLLYLIYKNKVTWNNTQTLSYLHKDYSELQNLYIHKEEFY